MNDFADLRARIDSYDTRSLMRSRYVRPARDWSGILFPALITLGALALIAGAIVFSVASLEAHSGMHCVRSHDETYLMPVTTGKTTTLIPETDTVCDEWVPNQPATPTP